MTWLRYSGWRLAGRFFAVVASALAGVHRVFELLHVPQGACLWYHAICLRAVAGCLLVAAVCCQAAPPKPAAASNAMALETAYPDHMGTALKAIRNNDKELAAYLSSPETVCTVFVPTNKVCRLSHATESSRVLGFHAV